MTDLTLIEAKDILDQLNTKIAAKSAEIGSLNNDVKELAEKSPDPGLSTEERLVFSEKKADQVKRIRAAITLAEHDLHQLNSRLNEVKRVETELEARAKMEPAVAQFMAARHQMMAAWETIEEAANQCPAICEPNFPKASTLDDVVRGKGAVEIEKEGSTYWIKAG